MVISCKYRSQIDDSSAKNVCHHWPVAWILEMAPTSPSAKSTFFESGANQIKSFGYSSLVNDASDSGDSLNLQVTILKARSSLPHALVTKGRESNLSQATAVSSEFEHLGRHIGVKEHGFGCHVTSKEIFQHIEHHIWCFKFYWVLTLLFWIWQGW